MAPDMGGEGSRRTQSGGGADNHPGYSDLIPDDLQTRLLSLADEIQDHEWEIGLYAVELCDEWRTHGISRVKVCDAIAVFCKERGNTIRDYEYTARNVPQSIVTAHPELGRSHFRELIPWCKSPQEYERAIESWKKSAQTLSVRSLQAHLARKNGAPPRWEGRLARAAEILALLGDDDEAPRVVRTAARDFLRVTSKLDG